MRSATPTQGLPTALSRAYTSAIFCGIIARRQATSPPSPSTSWILSRRSRQLVASNSTSYQKNTEGKLLKEIKTLQIQEVKVPTIFKELHQTLLFYSGITSILFGPRSALVAGVKSFATAILLEKIIFKGHIASDSKLPAKILYALEIRIQHWLGECFKFEDRSMVNDRLVCFDEVFKMVMNSTINITLPPNFVKPAQKSPPTSTGAASAEGDGKKKGGTKRKLDKINEKRYMTNPAPISEFLMKDGENWKKHFAGKCSKVRPKWDDTTFMCACWHIRGKCFVTATTKQVTLERPPSPKQRRTIFRPTSPKFTGRITSSPRLDFPGRGLAMPGSKKSLPTNSHTPNG